MSGILFMATADTGDASMWTTSSGVEISSAQKRTGTYSFKLGAGDYLQKAIPPSATLPYLRVALLAENSGSPFLDIQFRESSSLHLTVRVDWVAGLIKVYRGSAALGTLLGSCSVNLPTDVWHIVELYGTLHDTTGTVTARMNGVEVLTLTGKDTKAGGVGSCDNVYLAGSGAIYVDDVILRDDTWPGTGGIYVLAPTGAGSRSDWDASAGDPYACVDEKPPTFTDYIYSAPSEYYPGHDFAFENLPALTYESVNGVAVCAYARLDTAGSASFVVYAGDGITSEGGDAFGLTGTTPLWGCSYFPVDVIDEPWDETKVNALICGVEMR